MCGRRLAFLTSSEAVFSAPPPFLVRLLPPSFSSLISFSFTASSCFSYSYSSPFPSFSSFLFLLFLFMHSFSQCISFFVACGRLPSKFVHTFVYLQGIAETHTRVHTLPLANTAALSVDLAAHFLIESLPINGSQCSLYPRVWECFIH